MAQRLAALTGMRGVAALLVLGYHAVLIFWLAQLTFGWEADAWTRPASAWFFGAGWIGVDFFFVLSGFLLSGPLLDAAGDLPSWPSYRLFAAKRLLRIAPPYYASFLVIFLLAGWSGHAAYATDLKDLVLHVLYLHTFSPEHQFRMSAVAWTLSVELQFYLLLPLLVLPFRKVGDIAALPLLALGVAFAAWAYDPSDPAGTRFLVFQFPAFLGHFAFGILAARLHRRLAAGHWAWDAAALLAILLLIILPAANIGYTHQFAPPPSLVHLLFVRPAAALAFAMLILAALRPGSRIGRALEWRPLTWAGEVSYSLYLVHLAAGGIFLVTEARWAFSHGLPFFLALMSATALLIAWAFYHAFEGPSLRWKDRVSARLEASRLA